MMFIDEMATVVAIGVGATLAMDIWSVILKYWGIPSLNYAFVGRWAGHLCRGRLSHPNIAQATPVRGELQLGWTIHYLVGIAFSALLVGIFGMEWLHRPTWLPAIAIGMVTLVFPFFVMQPAMGAGIAASRTPTPLKSCLRSLAAHAVFGCGLYLSAETLRLLGDIT